MSTIHDGRGSATEHQQNDPRNPPGEKSKIPPRGIFSRRKLVIFPLVLQLSQLKVYQGKGDELILNDVEMFPLQAARIIQASKKLGIKVVTRSDPKNNLLYVYRKL
jgi:hypothetical protein